MKIFCFLTILFLQVSAETRMTAGDLPVAPTPSASNPSPTPYPPPGDLSPTSIALRIQNDDGYQITRFVPSTAEPYQLAVQFKGSEETLDIPQGHKEYIIAVRLGQHSTTVQAVRIYFDTGSVSTLFANKRFPDNLSLKSELEEVANGTFLILHSASGEVELSVRVHKPKTL